MKFQRFIFYVTLTILIESVYSSDYLSLSIIDELASDAKGILK